MDTNALRVPATRTTAAAVPVQPLATPLELLAPGGRLVTSRPMAAAAAFAARLGLLHGHAVWKSLERPAVALALDDRTGATWLRDTFEPASRGRRFHALTWQAIRAVGFLTDGGEPLALGVAREALGRELRQPRVALLSLGANVMKSTFFVTEAGCERPTVVVSVLSGRGRRDWIARELQAVDTLRRRFADVPDLVGALPDEPLLVDERDGRTLVVAACNDVHSARGGHHDELAFRWLERFQAATRTDRRPLTLAEEHGLLESARKALAGREGDAADEFLADLERRLVDLRGASIARCGVHGDFWVGNLAIEAGRLRVYDWEWFAGEGLASLDYAMWCFGPLLEQDRPAGRAEITGATAWLASVLPQAGVPAAFAPVALVDAACEWALRAGREFGAQGAAQKDIGATLLAMRPLLRDHNHGRSTA